MAYRVPAGRCVHWQRIGGRPSPVRRGVPRRQATLWLLHHTDRPRPRLAGATAGQGHLGAAVRLPLFESDEALMASLPASARAGAVLWPAFRRADAPRSRRSTSSARAGAESGDTPGFRLVPTNGQRTGAAGTDPQVSRTAGGRCCRPIARAELAFREAMLKNGHPTALNDRRADVNAPQAQFHAFQAPALAPACARPLLHMMKHFLYSCCNPLSLFHSHSPLHKSMCQEEKKALHAFAAA